MEMGKSCENGWKFSQEWKNDSKAGGSPILLKNTSDTVDGRKSLLKREHV